jgi:hypothetical protein
MFGKLKETYRLFLSDKPADITLQLDVIDQPGHPGEDEDSSKKDLLREKLNIGKNRSFDIAYDPAGRKFRVVVERSMFTSSLKLRPMNQLMRLCYYTGVRSHQPGRPPWMLIHSCGILRKGKVLIFTGPSEIGKTTVGRLCGEAFGLPLNDEMLLLSWPGQPDGCILVKSPPILGELPFTTNAIVPLARVFLLKQSKRIAVRRLGRMEAYLRFMYQVITPMYFKENGTRAAICLVEEFAGEVTRATPFFELEFTRDKNLLWEVESKITELKAAEA